MLHTSIDAHGGQSDLPRQHGTGKHTNGDRVVTVGPPIGAEQKGAWLFPYQHHRALRKRFVFFSISHARRFGNASARKKALFASFSSPSFIKRRKKGGRSGKNGREMQECEQFVTFKKKKEKMRKGLEKKRKMVYHIRWGTMGDATPSASPNHIVY
jgi:hypothetical protein